MRIGIDAHTLGTHAGGNETFVRQLLTGLRQVSPETGLVALVNRDVHRSPEGTGGFPTHPMPTRSSWVRVPLVLPWLAWRLRLDLLHVQYTAPPYCPCPYVVTLHDVVWERFPETLPWADRYRLRALTRSTVRRARRVFCVSEAIKREASETYGIPLERIDVVTNAVDPMYRPIRDPSALDAVRRKYGLPTDFVLYVGALGPRKNLARLAEAFGRLERRGLPHRLVLAGRPTFYGRLRKQLQDLNLGDRLMLTGYVPVEDLPALMSAASAFAYVSLYEGFGIPVVEALACGTPTLISIDPALMEVAGGLAVPCDPFDVDAIEQGLVQVLTDSSLRDDVRTRGPERAQFYSCEKMDCAALDGYEKALA